MGIKTNTKKKEGKEGLQDYKRIVKTKKVERNV